MNKKFTLTLLALIFGVFCINAQTQQNHKKRTYSDAEGNFYINKALPVYLTLSTSPDGKENAHMLKSKQTAKYTNPMYFDTEGMNTIKSPWAVDPETRRTVQPQQHIVFEVYADGKAPHTWSKFYGAPKYYKSGTIYYGKGLNVDLTSKDAVSGVENTYYSIKSRAYQNYSTSIALNKEGQTNLKYYASDNVGNAENPTSKDFIVDLSNPKTNHSTSQPKLGDILSPKAKISLSKSDNLAGVKNTKYFFDGRTALIHSKDISLWSLSDGDHTLTYYSTDNVLNIETKNTYKFYLDKIPPVVEYAIQGDQYFGKYKYISPRTKINLTASDNKAGVESITYLIDYSGKTTFSSAYKMPERNGIHTATYYATDKVTNKSNNKVLTVYMDNINPTTGIKYGSPQFFARDTLFINKDTKITLFFHDYQSGVKQTEYGVDGKTGNIYSSPITVSKEGHHKINFHTTDRVNNKEQIKESEFFVDNTPPVIYTNFSIKQIGTRSKGGQTYSVYPNYTRLYVGATDTHCGTHRILYSVNGSAFKDYSSPYTLDISEISHFRNKKFYTVVIKTQDKLGNESSKTIEFFVGRE